jgi:hypothetical protein
MRTTRTILAAMAASLMTLSAIPASAAPQQHNHAPQQQRGNNNHGGGNEYGNWNSGWGARPPAPPRGFSRHNDWYRHVRACGQRYRSYNAATDRYTVRRGQTAVCRL